MKTHYWKTKLKNVQKMPTALHSFVYSELPDDRLFTIEEMRKHFESLGKERPFMLKDVLPTSDHSKLGKLFEQVIGQFVADKMAVAEIHYSRLEKLVKELTKV